MREIKFRAWVKETKQIIPHEVLNFNDFLHIDELSYCWDIDILMQYTGLKDKKWIGIYEGDIVCEYLNNGKIKNYTEIKWKDWWFFPLTLYALECEVVGNIYENPDLLDNDLIKWNTN